MTLKDIFLLCFSFVFIFNNARSDTDAVRHHGRVRRSEVMYESCQNRYDTCEEWSSKGLCSQESYRDYMVMTCPVSCGLCAGGSNPAPALDHAVPTNAGVELDKPSESVEKNQDGVTTNRSGLSSSSSVYESTAQALSLTDKSEPAKMFTSSDTVVVKFEKEDILIDNNIPLPELVDAEEFHDDKFDEEDTLSSFLPLEDEARNSTTGDLLSTATQDKVELETSQKADSQHKQAATVSASAPENTDVQVRTAEESGHDEGAMNSHDTSGDDASGEDSDADARSGIEREPTENAGSRSDVAMKTPKMAESQPRVRSMDRLQDIASRPMKTTKSLKGNTNARSSIKDSPLDDANQKPETTDAHVDEQRRNADNRRVKKSSRNPLKNALAKSPMDSDRSTSEGDTPASEENSLGTEVMSTSSADRYEGAAGESEKAAAVEVHAVKTRSRIPFRSKDDDDRIVADVEKGILDLLRANRVQRSAIPEDSKEGSGDEESGSGGDPVQVYMTLGHVFNSQYSDSKTPSYQVLASNLKKSIESVIGGSASIKDIVFSKTEVPSKSGSVPKVRARFSIDARHVQRLRQLVNTGNIRGMMSVKHSLTA